MAEGSHEPGHAQSLPVTPVWPRRSPAHTPHRVHHDQATELQLTLVAPPCPRLTTLCMRSSGASLHFTGAALLSSQCRVVVAPSVACFFLRCFVKLVGRTGQKDKHGITVGKHAEKTQRKKNRGNTKSKWTWAMLGVDQGQAAAGGPSLSAAPSGDALGLRHGVQLTGRAGSASDMDTMRFSGELLGRK